MILRSTFAQAPDWPFVCYLTVAERMPLKADIAETFGIGGLLPETERRWVWGTARPETLDAAGVFQQASGEYIAFKELEDQVLFRLKYEGQLR